MSTEQQEPAEPGRRKFDDVASLFGGIVPAPGTPVRPHVARPPTVPTEPLAPPPDFGPDTPDSDKIVRPRPFQVPPTEAEADADTSVDLRQPQPLPTRPGTTPEPAFTPPPPPGSAPTAEIPWPDAFTPRPNYRRNPSSRAWSWLILVPLGAVVAFGITMVDPRTMRDWADRHILHREPPPPTSIDSALLPQAFRETPQPSQPANPAASAPASAPTSPPATQTPGPAAITAPSPSQNQPAFQAGSPAQAIAPSPVYQATEDAARQPVPVAPTDHHDAPSDTPAPAAAPSTTPTTSDGGAATAPPTQATPPDVPLPPPMPATAPTSAAAPAVPVPVPVPAPASAAADSAPAIARIVIHYRRNAQGAEAEARRIAAQLQKTVGTVELRATNAIVRSPVINYAVAADREAASSYAKMLAGDDHGGWIVRSSPNRSGAGQLEIWLP